MFELMTVKPAVANAVAEAQKLNLTTSQAEITFDDVVFQYVKGKEILKGLTFKVRYFCRTHLQRCTGEKLASGACWKSCCHCWRVWFGEVDDYPITLSVFGTKQWHNISGGQRHQVTDYSMRQKRKLLKMSVFFLTRSVDMDSLRKNIAIVPQDTVLFHNTIWYCCTLHFVEEKKVLEAPESFAFRHNIRYGDLDATDKRVMTAARMAELHETVIGWPAGEKGAGHSNKQGWRS